MRRLGIWHIDRYEEDVEDGELPESLHGATGRLNATILHTVGDGEVIHGYGENVWTDAPYMCAYNYVRDLPPPEFVPFKGRVHVKGEGHVLYTTLIFLVEPGLRRLA